MAVITTNSAPRAAEGAIGAWGFGLARMVSDWWSYRKTVRALAALTDRELDDIGISRGEIKFVARRRA